jgi:hypothetical protein
VSADPIACTEDGDITWIRRDGCTRAQARRFCVEEAGHFTLSDWKVNAGHIRELAIGDCPMHPTGDRDEYCDDGECRCFQIEDGWWDECPRTHPDAVACWRVEFQPVEAKSEASKDQ